RSFADWDCRNGEKGSGQSPFPFSSHREAAKPLPCDGAQARYSIKSLYYIEITDWRTGFYESLIKLSEPLKRLYERVA
ncbi:hypothetical protein, partial [Treponema endosymbiont of Eucomonympha sp.]|uniref:hypothetical protein n=1 Tax=Treponema endosymbiont of Eucomonympha sp. TaxID=1580831 RepID=UPI000AE45492